jgi:hypothetical protein
VSTTPSVEILDTTKVPKEKVVGAAKESTI